MSASARLRLFLLCVAKMSRFRDLDLLDLVVDVADGDEEADMSEDSCVVKARVVEEEISLLLGFLERGIP